MKEKIESTIEVKVDIDSKVLDDYIKKANQLIELLQEVQQIIHSLSKENKKISE